MKGDFTRSTFRPTKHYSSVRMQQGRVQLDADWNEQVDISTNRVESETSDVVGGYGVPMENPGFEIMLSGDSSSLSIGKGRIYLDGILVENDSDVNITAQNDFLPGYALPINVGHYIAYLDTWQRHVTALEDDLIREKALGGPETATRTQTVWQVRLLRTLEPFMPHPTCSGEVREWGKIVGLVPGKMSARIHPGTKPATLCEAPAEAGYRRLENQLYRVEIHTPGSIGIATFKWSRDNGSIVTPWNGQDGRNLIVGSIGRDQVLGFAAGQTVELTDDERELRGEPGVLVKLGNAEGQILTLDPSSPSVDRSAFGRNPKVRRWDSDGEIKTGGSWIPLEDGVEVRFEENCDYKTGDCWMIPARTAKNGIEWPEDETNPGNPAAVPRQGIEHHYCRLAILEFDGTKWTRSSDCRPKFPPLTMLTSLDYVSGDGQEATPKSSNLSDLVSIEQPLKVGVANGSFPVSGINVIFEVTTGNGQLSGDGQLGNRILVQTVNGIAECRWKLDSETQSQQVKASLADVEGEGKCLPVIFTANLSRATHVYYKPGCPLLANVITVQDAIDELCRFGRGPGCCVTVSPKDSLPDVIGNLNGKEAVRLCLLAGRHVISKDIIVKGRVWFEIFGCGADVQMNCEQISIDSEFIGLSNLKFYIENGKGQICLSGKNIKGEQNLFVRNVGDRTTPPLVLVKPPDNQKTSVELYWRDNWMTSSWQKIDSKRLGAILIPHQSIKISPELRSRLGLLAGITRARAKGSYEETAKIAANEISTLNIALRGSWAKSVSKDAVNILDVDSQKAVKAFFTEVTKKSVSEVALLEALKRLVASFKRRSFNQALALACGVGGWIEGNTIQGYLALHYFDNKTFKNLAWGLTQDKQDIKKAFATKYEKSMILLDPESLVIKGNRVLSIHSNGRGTIDVISQILGGNIPSFTPPPGYQSLHVADNIFKENNSSFIAISSILSGNQFNGAETANDVGAYVWGNSGIFMGNVAPSDSSRIEVILMRMRTQANLTNLLQII